MTLFTELLQTSILNKVQQVSVHVLENLSTKFLSLLLVSEQLKPKSVFLCFICLIKPLLSKAATHILYGRLYSTKSTFCVNKADAIMPLVACLDHRSISLEEDVLTTILMNSININQDVGVSIFLPSTIRSHPFIECTFD